MKFLIKKRELPLYVALIIFALFFVLTQNIAFWRNVFEIVPFNSKNDYIFIALLFLFLSSLTVIFFSLILWPRITYPLLTLLIILAGLFNYFSFHYKIYMDREMLTNIIETNSSEVIDLLSIKLLLWISISTLLPLILLTRIKIVPVSFFKSVFQRAALITGASIILALIAFGFYKDFASFIRNNKPIVKLIMPSSIFASSISYAQQNYAKKYPFKEIANDAKFIPNPTSKKQLMIMVVGETARKQNFSLNGYTQFTNPKLSTQENLLSFKNVTSCGTATAVSVPCMFSLLTRSEFDKKRAESQENVLDIIQKAGYKILWRENDNGCKDVCNRVPTAHVAEYTDALPAANGFYYDEYLLTDLESYISNQNNENLLIVLHMNGSHGPTYYQRYPEAFRKFTPTCDTNRIETCSTESLVNTYDNTILYTDYVLNQTIELLRKYDDQYETSMLYISDHGESLGEKGMYLHGAPYIIAPLEQISVPLIFWANQSFYQNRGINLHCLQEKSFEKEYSHDNIFHTLLGLLHIKTDVYQAKLNIFNGC